MEFSQTGRDAASKAAQDFLHFFSSSGFKCLLMMVLCGGMVSSASAQMPKLGSFFFKNEKTKADQATSGQQASRQAMRAIPWNALTGPDQRRVQSVLADVTLYRKMPRQVIFCDHELFLFLKDHPDVVVSIWQLLGITQITLQELETDRYQLLESAGTTGTVDVLHRSDQTQVLYTEGIYHGPLFNKPIEGKTVLLMKTTCLRSQSGKDIVACSLDAFVRIDNSGVDLMAKLFQPVMGKIADNNFEQTIQFIANISRTAEVNPQGLQEVAYQLPNIRNEVRQEFATIAKKVALKEYDQHQYAEMIAKSTRTEPPVPMQPSASSVPTVKPETANSELSFREASRRTTTPLRKTPPLICQEPCASDSSVLLDYRFYRQFRVSEPQSVLPESDEEMSSSESESSEIPRKLPEYDRGKRKIIEFVSHRQGERDHRSTMNVASEPTERVLSSRQYEGWSPKRSTSTSAVSDALSGP